MSMERSRRDRFTSVAPNSDELKAATLAVRLCLVLMTPLVVQSIVAWFTSGHLCWPSRRLPQAYAGLARGHFGAGLRPNVADALPSDPSMWAFTTLTLLLGAGAVIIAFRRVHPTASSRSRHGLATGAQAVQALGLPRLRGSAEVIRPDLYSRSKGRGRRGHSAGRP